jgi:hypothetical protein
MRRIANSRPSPAIVVAIVALVAGLAGTAVAGPGAETSAVTKKKVKKIANRQINKRLPWGTAAIADNAITTPKIADDAVTAPKLAAITTRSATFNVPDGGYGEGTVQCQSGERALSGGVRIDNTALATFTPIVESHKEGNGWYARVNNGSGTGDRVATVEVYCLG